MREEPRRNVTCKGAVTLHRATGVVQINVCVEFWSIRFESNTRTARKDADSPHTTRNVCVVKRVECKGGAIGNRVNFGCGESFRRRHVYNLLPYLRDVNPFSEKSFVVG